jgi:hypothetical protein
MTENTTPQLTDQDKADLEKLGLDENGEPRQNRCLLIVWEALLADIEGILAKKIPANVAAKVVASWPKLSFQDTAQYHVQYHELLLELRETLHQVILDNPDALQWRDTDDAEKNRQVYIDLLISWHLFFDAVEADWDATDEDSHIQLAALVDARTFVFSSMGLAGHLNAIGFELQDEEFGAALDAAAAEPKEA